jgi:hypothetical protein
VGPTYRTESAARALQVPPGQFLSQRTETTFRPAQPALSVGTDVDQVHTALVRPGHTFIATFHRPQGDPQPRGGKVEAVNAVPTAKLGP